jgi:MerR HTH family regulatory protein
VPQCSESKIHEDEALFKNLVIYAIGPTRRHRRQRITANLICPYFGRILVVTIISITKIGHAALHTTGGHPVHQYYTLGDVARAFGLKPHVVTYAITAGHLPEPAIRVGNKRVFTKEDMERMALHFRVTPRWDSLRAEAEPQSGPGVEMRGLSLKKPFSVESADDSRHEVKDGAGAIQCWTAQRATALLIAGLLESAVRG